MGTISANTYMYSGWFLKSQFEGYGQMLAISGQEKVRWKGWFKAGQPWSKGQILQIRDDKIYCGRHFNNKPNGDGTLLTDQFYYIGSFFEGNKHGMATEIYQGQITSDQQYFYRFDGIFSNNIKNHQGQLKAQLYRTKLSRSNKQLDVGSIIQQYCGGFQNNQFNGQATYHVQDYNKTECSLIQFKAIQFTQLKIKNFSQTCALRILVQYGFQASSQFTSKYHGQFINGQFDGDGTLIMDEIQCEVIFSKGTSRQANLKKILRNGIPMSIESIQISIDEDIPHQNLVMNIVNGCYIGKCIIKALKCNLFRTVEFKSDKGDLVWGQTKHSIEPSNYNGDLKSNLKDGYGEQIDSHGNSYKGYFFNNKRHGHGIFSGSTIHYEGYWENDKYSGQGVLTQDNKGEGLLTYKGTFVNGEYHGKGLLKTVFGDFEGQFEFGKIHGRGKVTISNSEYLQQFFNNMEEVPLKSIYQKTNLMYHSEGNIEQHDYYYVYEGDFFDQKKHGKGVEKLFDQTYEGDFEHDLRQGKGKLLWNDGTLYEGEFFKGNQHGQGKLIYEGYTYSGQFIDNKDTGYGQIIYPGGQIYTGEHFKAKRHGKGKLILLKGDIFEGEWIQGKLQGQVIITNHYGSVYQGNWFNNRPNGKGVLKWIVNGNTYLKAIFEGNISGQTIELDSELFKLIRKIQLVEDFNDTQSIEYTYDGIWKDGQYSYGKLLTKDKYYEGYFYNNRVQAQNPNQIQSLTSGALSMILVSKQSTISQQLQLSVPSQAIDKDYNDKEFQNSRSRSGYHGTISMLNTERIA